MIAKVFLIRHASEICRKFSHHQLLAGMNGGRGSRVLSNRSHNSQFGMRELFGQTVERLDQNMHSLVRDHAPYEQYTKTLPWSWGRLPDPGELFRVYAVIDHRSEERRVGKEC